MRAEILLSLLLSAVPGQPVETATTVTHFLEPPAAQWSLELRTGPGGTPSARLWWIEGPAVHRGMPERLIRKAGIDEADLPDHVTAKIAELDAVGCPALTRIAADLAELSPGATKIELAGLEADDPLIRWAEGAWPKLAACADASTD